MRASGFTKTLRMLAAACIVCACASQPKLPTQAEPGLAPHPYTADEIRAALPQGSVLVFRMQWQGEPAVVRRMQFVSCDAEQAVIEEIATQVERVGSVPPPQPKRIQAKWADLRKHASFPIEKTTLTNARCSVPAGEFDCWLYTVASDRGGKPTLERYYFAPELPGPPVLYEIEQAGANLMRMELIESKRPKS